MRPNGVGDSAALPRHLLLRCGPLCPAAVAALTAAAATTTTTATTAPGDDGPGSWGGGVAIQVSCYGLTVKLPGHLPLQVVLPYAAVADDDGGGIAAEAEVKSQTHTRD